MKSFHQKIHYSFIIFFLVFFVYILFAGRFHFLFPTSIYNYFSYLAEAFLHGSFSFVSYPPNLHDLTIFNGKIYMYWGPTTILPILPFIVLFGKNFSDSLYTAVIASFNPLIFYLILVNLEKLMIIKLSNFKKIILCIFFAFGTVHFYLSIIGNVWFTAQTISIFFLLIAIYFVISFALYKRVTKLVLASLFFGFAFVSRATLIFYIPIFLAFILIPYLQNKQKKYLIYNLAIFISISLFVSGLNFDYNYLRFGSFFESGHSYHNLALHFAADRAKFGTINSIYIPKNLYYMFVNIPTISNQFPYLTFDKEGNSILFTSPFLLLAINIVRKKYWQSKESKLLNLSIMICIFSTIIFLLNYFSTGWVQFGYRYLLDIIPGLLMILAIVINNAPIRLLATLFTLSIIFNILGTLWFMYL